MQQAMRGPINKKPQRAPAAQGGWRYAFYHSRHTGGALHEQMKLHNTYCS